MVEEDGFAGLVEYGKENWHRGQGEGPDIAHCRLRKGKAALGESGGCAQTAAQSTVDRGS